ncbi:ATP-binding protein [Labrys portucalensis]|uniref:ATP-binding protein n=1 Tax=Labrys neptuniae TaxID=376174 RepID=A0ABV6ZPM0_9HYPH
MTDPIKEDAPETKKDDPNAVDASPTKEFFVDTITRDIALDRALADLVDNCIDGAKRLRDAGHADENIAGGKRYENLYARLTVNPNEFVIADNCGGIAIDTARKYAFKFGRATGFTETPNSVGQFGVGMKRALFKMGKRFEVKTADTHDSYRIEVNVPEWLGESSWDFRIEDRVDNANGNVAVGTTIRSWELYRGVSELFGQEYFLRNLIGRIRTAQQHFMRNGFAIYINDEAIIPNEWQLQRGAGIDPLHQRFEDQLGDGPPLRTRIFAGVGPSNQAQAGWYVFCNGRCIVEADQSSATGWGDLAGVGGIGIPRYHNQFARFRGYAFLDCAKSEKLPWNTTKTGLDYEDPAYRMLFGRLITAARPVIDFLNELDRETDIEEQDRELSTSLRGSTSTPIADLPERAAFTYSIPARRGPTLKPISYKKPETEVGELAAKLKVRAPKDVGIRSFEYAYQRLVVEDDL